MRSPLLPLAVLALSGSLTFVAGLPSSVVPSQRSTSLQYMGVNIAGFDFGCGSDGTCVLSQVSPPLKSLGGADGAGQMSHFVKDDRFNIFRLPVGWQWLLNNTLGGTLDPTNAGKYDQLVQACLATGASCIIDIHNYARWNGQVIGQGGSVTDANFVSIWTQLATKYGNQSKVIFALMNEPHDLQSVSTWAATLQKVVTAIRNITKANMILLPGSGWMAAGALPWNAGLDLLKVKNPDGSTTGLVFDVHQYLDSDGSGTGSQCVTNNTVQNFAPLATWLRKNSRQALTTETGGGNTASCLLYLCQEIQFIAQNSDVFLGVLGWGAGGFSQTYKLTETPTHNGANWTDQSLVSSCLVPYAPS